MKASRCKVTNSCEKRILVRLVKYSNLERCYDEKAIHDTGFTLFLKVVHEASETASYGVLRLNVRAGF